MSTTSSDPAAGWCRPCTRPGFRPASAAGGRQRAEGPGLSAGRRWKEESSSAVRPPLIGRRDGAALVLDRDAAQRIILALGVARPVVGHLDAGERGVAVEDDAEEVE